MAKAIFAVRFENGTPVLPPMQAEDGGVQLFEVIDGRVREGCGFSCIGLVPNAPSCLVRVDTSAETIAAMKADPQYLHVEDVADAESAV